MKKDLSIDVLNYTSNLSLITDEEKKILTENRERFEKVMTKTYVFRTDVEKKSIVNDIQFPTPHAKLHQSMLEQKVQLDQLLLLAKDYEIKKLEIEESDMEIEDLESQIKDNPTLRFSEQLLDGEIKKLEIKLKKKQIENQYEKYNLNQMKINMEYRMKEIVGWKKIQDAMIKQLKDEGYSEDFIWDKEAGQIESNFFLFLNKLQALPQTTDSAEQNNLISLADFAIKEAKERGIFEQLKSKCTKGQLEAIAFIEKNIRGGK